MEPSGGRQRGGGTGEAPKRGMPDNRSNRSPSQTAARQRPPQRMGGAQLGLRLKSSSTVALVFSNSHCWLGEAGSHTFMKTRRSPGLLSMQLLLMGWNRLLSWGGKRGDLETECETGSALKSSVSLDVLHLCPLEESATGL